MKRSPQILAIALSSLLAMPAVLHADTAGIKPQAKASPSQPTNSAPAVAKQEPAKKHSFWKAFQNGPAPTYDPSLYAAAAQAPQPTLFKPLPVIPPPGVVPDTEKVRFPWKEQIVTTTFNVGETPTQNNPVPNTRSSWDKDWVANYGGFDTPDPAKRKDFIPVDFTPRQNPFYVALPYNDMETTGFKAEAPQVVPWFKTAYQGPMQSVCKDRWIAIRYKNKVVYAQWEDCGPFLTDNWQYVFGNERPKPNLNHGAGLDVSPAVRDYLGMNSSDITDWRFVEFSEVPQGPWAKYGDNNPFVTNQRKQADRLAENERKESQRLEELRDKTFQENGYQ